MAGQAGPNFGMPPMQNAFSQDDQQAVFARNIHQNLLQQKQQPTQRMPTNQEMATQILQQQVQNQIFSQPFPQQEPPAQQQNQEDQNVADIVKLLQQQVLNQ